MESAVVYRKATSFESWEAGYAARGSGPPLSADYQQLMESKPVREQGQFAKLYAR
jgi:hypothetical protein